MTPAARPPFRPHPAMAGAIIALCLGLIVWMISYIIPFQLAGQAYLMIAILLAFRYWPPMARWVASMPGAHRLVFAVLLGAMLLGHYTIRGRAWYPFIVWEIFPFVHDTDPVTAREFIATTESGARVRLLPEQLFPSIVQVDPIDSLDNPDLYPPGTTDRLALALARAYNEQHPSDKLREVDLYVMAVHLHPPAGEVRTQPSCELLKHYDVSSDQ
jgi:hypothetical protein